MIIKKNITLKSLITFSWYHMIWIIVWSTLVPCLFVVFKLQWLSIPWVPISIVSTAVAFYIGFKNNSAYDRLWEARKIWGAIINSSRMLSATVKSYIGNQFTDVDISDNDLLAIHKRILYRHIAYLYTLRNQLLIPTSWEHVNQSKHVKRINEKRKQSFGMGLFQEDNLEDVLTKYLDKNEMEKVIHFKNTATQLIDNQSQDLAALRKENLIDDFRHMELQKLLNDFYTHQGKCERIKKFPLPRQYAGMSFIFVAIFIFILPFGLVGEFSKLGSYGIWLSIPFTALVSWIFLMMELIGDYSENPFEGLANDIPMLSLCRVIEIDLLEMLGETNIPQAIQAKNEVLM